MQQRVRNRLEEREHDVARRDECIVCRLLELSQEPRSEFHRWRVLRWPWFGRTTSERHDPADHLGDRALSVDQAESACASLRPKGGLGGGNNVALAAYRNCLKLHGVTLPSGRGIGGFGGSGTSTSTTSDPKVKAALAACATLRPKGAFGGGFPGGTTTTTS